MGAVFCFGLGYTGQRLQQALMTSDWQVAGCRRADFTDPQHEADILAADTLLASIPPATEPPYDPAIDQWYQAIHRSQARQIIYLSSTGVYEEQGGAWVDEHAAVDPDHPRILAERAWQRFDKPVASLRLAGIYGPGKGLVNSVQQGSVKQRVKAPGQLFNRIHVDDIVSVIIALLHQPTHQHTVYNIADGMPASQRVTVEQAARLLNKAPPPLKSLADAELSEMAQRFYQSNKRVDSRAVQRALGVHWRYPSYREGFKSLV